VVDDLIWDITLVMPMIPRICPWTSAVEAVMATAKLAAEVEVSYVNQHLLSESTINKHLSIN
jgi:hypothetical protein